MPSTASGEEKSSNAGEQLSVLDDLYGEERGVSCPERPTFHPRGGRRGHSSNRGFGRGRHRQDNNRSDRGGRGRYRGNGRGRGRGRRGGGHGSHQERSQPTVASGNTASTTQEPSVASHNSDPASTATPTPYSHWWSQSSNSAQANAANMWQWTQQPSAVAQNTPWPSAAGANQQAASSSQGASAANLAWYNFV